MNHGILNWRALIAYGALLCAFGLFGPELSLWGALNYVWAVLAGLLLVMVGLGTAIVVAATRHLGTSRHMFWWAASANDDYEGIRSHGAMGTIGASCQLHTDFGERTGPLVNVDGTPMLDDLIDVAGKFYGDSGTSFNYDVGPGMSDGDFSSYIDTHHNGSDW